MGALVSEVLWLGLGNCVESWNGTVVEPLSGGGRLEEEETKVVGPPAIEYGRLKKAGAYKKGKGDITCVEKTADLRESEASFW